VDPREVDLTRFRRQRAQAGGRSAGPLTHGSLALAPRTTSPAGRGRPSPLKVAPPAPVAVPRAPFVGLVLLVVVVGVLGILLLNTRVNENAFILHDLGEEQVVLDQRQQQLEQQIAQAAAPAQLDAAARRLGLVPAEDVAYLIMPEGLVLREPVGTMTGPAGTVTGPAGTVTGPAGTTDQPGGPTAAPPAGPEG
jgi:hypothetical protein